LACDLLSEAIEVAIFSNELGVMISSQQNTPNIQADRYCIGEFRGLVNERPGEGKKTSESGAVPGEYFFCNFLLV
jgi:hypothetical protein